MNQNVLQNVINFILKYIWAFCALLIVLELASVTYSASVLMQQSSLGVMQSVSGEISGRVDGVLRLLNGMAQDERFADLSKPLFERITQALPYQESYGLYMVALTDEDVNVVSADETEPPTENYSLAYRDYMQRLYSTGEYQITDAFLSGDGKETMNYTIAVPIMSDGAVRGSVFGSIYFNDIENILKVQSINAGRDFYLLGADNTIMAGEERAVNGKSFLELSHSSRFWGGDVNSIDSAIREGLTGSFWEWDNGGLTYVTHQRVTPTGWTILYRVRFMSMLAKLIPMLCVKSIAFVLICAAISVLSRRYLEHHLVQINHLLTRMSTMQKELFQSEQIDYDKLLEITEQGLSDQLTGLATRAVLFKKMLQLTDSPSFHGAIVFIDLDDLKYINDSFGHEGGDCALLHFARVLREYEQKHGGVAARYGGDEFILIFATENISSASEIVWALCHDLSTTILINGSTFPIHGSLGVSFCPEHGTRPEELICKSDLALYTAKREGKNRCEFYSGDESV